MHLRPHFTPMQWAWIILGPVIGLGAKVYEGWQMATTLMGLPLWVYECLGLVIFFCAIIGLLIGHRRDIEDRLSKKTEVNGQSPVIYPTFHEGIEFFATIDDLRSVHPSPETFKAGNEMHAYLISGEGIFNENSEYAKRFKRLILPYPNEHNLAVLRSFSRTINYDTQIMTCANKMREHDKSSVRFHENVTGTSLLFCNPTKQDAWVQIGTILPETESSNRPHFRIHRIHHEAWFLSLYGTFDRLWTISHPQTEEEAMVEGAEKERRL